MITSTPDVALAGRSVGRIKNKDSVHVVETVTSSGPPSLAMLTQLSNGPHNGGHVNFVTGDHNSNKARVEIADLQDWTPSLELKFAKWARLKALGRLSLDQQAEFERLSASRRSSSNPRSGEDIIVEYEQRVLTRTLVNALTQYVEFHKHHSPNRQRKTS